MTPKPVYIVVSTAPGEGVSLFGIYPTYLGLSNMIRDTFGEGARQESVELSRFPSAIGEGVQRGYRIRHADPARESSRVYLVLEATGA